MTSSGTESKLDRPFGILCTSLLIAICFWGVIFREIFATGAGDWQMIHHNWEVGYVSLSRYGEWPLWDPYHCGGVTMFGNPESQHFSPLFFLSFPLGTTLAIKLFLLLHATAGFAGMYVLARREYKISIVSSWLSAIVWGCSGFFAWHGSGGHGTFLPFYLSPWILIAWRATIRDWRCAPAISALLALTVFEGGTYPFPYFVILIVWDSLIALSSNVSIRKIIKGASLSCGLTLLLGAARFIPIYQTLKRLPRLIPNQDSLELKELLWMLVTRHHELSNPPHEFVWPEYGSFIGWGALIFAFVGIAALIKERRHLHLVASVVLFSAFVMGDRGLLFPWRLLHKLPVYDSLRVPSRMAVFLLLYIALCAAQGLDAFSLFLSRARVAWKQLSFSYARWIMAAAMAIDILATNLSFMNTWRWGPISPPIYGGHFHLTPAYNYHDIYASLPGQHVGTSNCYIGGMNWRVSPYLWVGDIPQARVTQGNGEIAADNKTTNTVWADVNLRTPAHIVFNQNYDPDWQTSKGAITEDSGRLAVDAPVGTYRITLRYKPNFFWPSLWITFVGVLAALGIMILRRRTELRTR